MNPHIAMPSADGEAKMIARFGITSDIVDAVIAVGEESKWQCMQLAPSLRGRTVKQTARNIHTFIRKYIRYVEDEPGKQWIKTPARTWADKVADCKGYSIFTSSILSCLGIPHAYRFVSYTKGAKVPRHVYIVAFDQGRLYPIDACLIDPLKELPYTYKQDIMTDIVQLSGADSGFGFEPGRTTEAQMDLLIARERLMLEKSIAEQQISGIGSAAITERDKALQAIELALTISNNPAQLMRLADGVGSTGIYGLRNFFRNVGQKAKKGVQAIKKAVTSIPKTAAKGLVEIILPKAAPFFLYLYIQDKQTIAKLPSKVANKRNKAQKLAKFVINTLGMQEHHFMGIVRNGIMKKYGRTPEQVLTSFMNGKSKISGHDAIGFVDALLQLINKLISLFKKQPPVGITAGDAPNPGDFEGFGQTQTKAYVQNTVRRNAQAGMPPLNPNSQARAVIPLMPPPVTDPGNTANNTGGGGGGGMGKMMPLLVGGAALLLLAKK